MDNENQQYQNLPVDVLNSSQTENKKARVWQTIKLFLEKIEPAFVKIFNTLFYWLLKFIKAFVGSIFKMILGKEV